MSAELKAQLVTFAGDIGFDSCRVAACAPPNHAKEFGEWLDDGAAGEMNYIARGAEKRRDPQKILPGARSIIVLALNYFQGGTAHKTGATGAARTAPYAWRDDYQTLVARKLDNTSNL